MGGRVGFSASYQGKGGSIDLARGDKSTFQTVSDIEKLAKDLLNVVE